LTFTLLTTTTTLLNCSTGADPQAQAQAILAQLQQLVQMQNLAGLQQQRPPQ
jgi:hypothetical protein